MNGPLTGWRVLLRIAWRDVLRNKGRSALILVMIALPVLGVTAAHVVIATAQVSTQESLDGSLGTADALLEIHPGSDKVFQGPDPADGGGWMSESGRRPATVEDLAAVIGGGARLVERREDWLEARFGDRLRPVHAISADLEDQIFDGTYELTAGRLPERAGEVLVNEALSDRGAAMGEKLDLAQLDADLDVVGIARHPLRRDQEVMWALPGTIDLGAADADHWMQRAYLVESRHGVDWPQVRALNELGAMVTSRKVLADPPPASELPEEARYDDGDEFVTTIALVIAMAVIEIVLLAGPSFAVGARRMQRQLAQLAASGATPAQVRRAVVATAVVLGAIAATVGLVGGIALGAAVLPLAQRFSGDWFGPFDLVWPHLLGIALLGWLSAVIAALVPAWIASRQDVVKALAGRRADGAPGKASPVLGLLIGGTGLAIAITASTHYDVGENSVALAAILVVLGAVLLLPPVVAVLGRVASGLPLALRYALRDAARHRTRTVPAIGAVLATVAGVVALGIANASDQAQARATYEPRAGLGDGFVSYYPDGITPEAYAERRPVVWQTVREIRPDAVAVKSFGTPDGRGPAVELRPEGEEHPTSLLGSWGGVLGSWVVADERPDVELWLDREAEAEADRSLAEGKVVLFTDDPKRAAGLDEARLEVWRYDENDGEGRAGKGVTVPAVTVEVERGVTQGIVPSAVAQRLGVPIESMAISLPGPLSEDDERAMEKALTAAGVPEADVYVERGWQEDRSYLILIWVLAAVGGLLMIGGTLTATFLALSDAAPDLATFSAVGGAPRERRLVAGAYALVVGGVGALVGAVVGFVPGIAGARSLTSTGWLDEGTVYHYLDIPWLLILGVVVGLPLLTALVVGLCARSRLPLVARID